MIQAKNYRKLKTNTFAVLLNYTVTMSILNKVTFTRKENSLITFFFLCRCRIITIRTQENYSIQLYLNPPTRNYSIFHYIRMQRIDKQKLIQPKIIHFEQMSIFNNLFRFCFLLSPFFVFIIITFPLDFSVHTYCCST